MGKPVSGELTSLVKVVKNPNKQYTLLCVISKTESLQCIQYAIVRTIPELSYSVTSQRSRFQVRLCGIGVALSTEAEIG